MAKQNIILEQLRGTPAAKLNPELFEKITKSNSDKNKKSAHVAQKLGKNEPKGLVWIIAQVVQLHLKFEPELRFHEFRKFRFDLALTDLKIAIEYEGLMSAKSRHTNVEGYTKDCEKYNLAQSMGWRVLRYTALNYEQFQFDIQKFL